MRFEPLVKKLTIVDKSGNEVRLNPNWAQRKYIAALEEQLERTGRMRVIVLKARQLGLSTIQAGITFSLCMVLDNYVSISLSHERDSAAHLLNMGRISWDNYPFRQILPFDSKHEATNTLSWTNGSAMTIATAKNKGAGRSRTPRSLHASEVAFYDKKAAATMLGMRNGVPKTDFSCIAIESTANGVCNFFHEQWEAAVNGDSDYQALFFPWHRHPEYCGSAIGISSTVTNLDDDERALARMGVSADRLAWRRDTIRNECDGDLLKFNQEYPTTPDEAFVSTGQNVFDAAKLTTIYQPKNGARGRLVRSGANVEFVPDTRGNLVVYKYPTPGWGVYVIGGDPTHTTAGDFAVGQVINRRTLEQVAVFRERVDPKTFAEELFKLGLYFNKALVAPEKEGPGYLTIGVLLGLNYLNVYKGAKPVKKPGKLVDHYGW